MPEITALTATTNLRAGDLFIANTPVEQIPVGDVLDHHRAPMWQMHLPVANGATPFPGLRAVDTDGDRNWTRDTTYGIPVYVPAAITVTEVWMSNSNIVSGGTLQFGLYEMDDWATTMRLYWDNGWSGFDISTTGVKKITGLSQHVDIGLYFLVWHPKAAAGTPSFQGYDVWPTHLPTPGTTATPYSQFSELALAGALSAWPSTFVSGNTSGQWAVATNSSEAQFSTPLLFCWDLA